jgi:regulator of protease activity HflC (stomatin/prohibitin superfamily)
MFGIFAFLTFIILGFSIYNVIATKINEKRDADKDNYRSKDRLFVISFFKKTLIVWIAAFLLFFSLSLTLVTVGGQEVVVVVTPAGVDDEELQSGWHLVMPWYDTFFMDKTYWVYSFTNSKEEGAKPTADAIWCPTKDGIKMGFDLSITWRINPDQASWIFETVSEQDEEKYTWIEENIIRAKVKSVMPLTVSKYTPIECYSYKRQEIQDEIFKVISKELKSDFKLETLRIDIREVFYNKEYEVSINNKKLAEQEALRLIEVTKQREEMLKQETINKDIAIQKAMGESKALQIKGESISNNPKIIELEWINKWNGQLPTYMMGSGGGQPLIMIPGK